MREATVEEIEGIYEYIKFISKKLVLTFLILSNCTGIIIV